MNCDAIAPWYQFLEYLAFGRMLERRRFEYLNETAEAQSALILGDGDGRFTAEFARRNPRASVDSMDASPEMLSRAKRRLSSASTRVRFWVGDARTINLPGTYDLVVTHFFLDCFHEDALDDLVARISECCEPGARWVVSEFGLPASGVARIAARALIRAMYFFFWVTTGLRVKRLPDYAPVLVRNGFRMVKRRATLGGLLVSEMWERTSSLNRLFGSQHHH